MLTFITNCQTTINKQIDAIYNCLKCRDRNANIEHLSREFPRIPPLIFLEVGHLTTCVDERSIEDIIMIPHKDNQLEYTLTAFTIHNGVHFHMKIKYQDERYIYDGMERPKMKKSKRFSSTIYCGRINCIVYLLTSVIAETT